MLEKSIIILADKFKKINSTKINQISDKKEFLNSLKFAFLDYNDWIILDASSSGLWMRPTLYSISDIENLKKQLPNFNLDIASVAYCHVISRDDHYLEPFWADEDKEGYPGIPLFFERHYCGYHKGKENYLEFNQLITHPLDLHWSPAKQSYCVMSDTGEEIEEIKLANHNGIKLVLMKRKVLDKLLHLGDWVLVRYFGFDLYRSSFTGVNELDKEICEFDALKIKCEVNACGVEKLQYIEYRGAQICNAKLSKKEVFDEGSETVEFASFIVQDRKNGVVLHDYSLKAENFANYFTESKLPWEISPIFFKAEVLDRYKNNPDRYAVDERSISCRGGWHLKTYDINQYNQVHTYAIYLGRLPYAEQLYWKSFNEEPKGDISERAMETDIKGGFSEPSIMSRFKKALEALGNIKYKGSSLSLWIPKGGDWSVASKGLFYVKTENANQWHDFIIALANTVIEGLQTESLKQIASDYGYNKENGCRSLGLIKYILENSDNSDSISKTHEILNNLQKARGQGKAHGAWKSPDGSLIEDGKVRLEKVINAVEQLNVVFNKLNN